MGALAAARLLQFASVLTLLGSTLFLLYAAPTTAKDAIAGPERQAGRWLLFWTSIVGVASAIAWLLAESVALTGSPAAWIEVLASTRLGAGLALRAGLLALSCVACVVVRPPRALSIALCLLAGVAVVSCAWTGHGTLGSGPSSRVHLWADVLHLVAAAVWIGALVALSSALLDLSHPVSVVRTARIALGLRRFSAIGPVVVAVLVLTGLVNSWFLLGMQQWRALFSNAYGVTLTVKVGLFGLMLGLATLHRFRTVPTLQAVLAAGTGTEAILRRLRTTMGIETALALLILIAVAVLGTLEPPVAL